MTNSTVKETVIGTPREASSVMKIFEPISMIIHENQANKESDKATALQKTTLDVSYTETKW